MLSVTLLTFGLGINADNENIDKMRMIEFNDIFSDDYLFVEVTIGVIMDI